MKFRFKSQYAILFMTSLFVGFILLYMYMRQVEQISIKNSHSIQQMLCIQEEMGKKVENVFSSLQSLPCSSEKNQCVIEGERDTCSINACTIASTPNANVEESEPVPHIETNELESALDTFIEKMDVEEEVASIGEGIVETTNPVESENQENDIDHDNDVDVDVKSMDVESSAKKRGPTRKKKTLDL